MARKPNDSKLDSKTARAKLRPGREPHWRVMEPGRSIGYRRIAKKAGTWIARMRVGDEYRFKALGTADDFTDADGSNDILDYGRAITRARDFFSAELKGPGENSPDKAPITVAEACAAHVAYLKAEKRTGHGCELSFAKYVLPKLGHRPVIELTTAEIDAMKWSMVKRDPDDPEVERKSKDSANRIMHDFRAALNRAFNDEANKIPSDAAWRRAKDFKDVTRARPGRLDMEQITRLINVSAGSFRNLIAGSLYTCARPPGELATVRVSDFDAQLGTLRVCGKTGERYIVLSAEAVEFFRGLAIGKVADDLLLPRDNGRPWKKNDHQRPMIDAVEAAKLPSGTTIYLLRHSAISHAILSGVPAKIVAENSGTSLKMLEKHYARELAIAAREQIVAGAMKLELPKSNITRLHG